LESLKLILSNILFFAPSWVFASLNIMTGTWVLYLPHIKNKFSLDDGQIGIALFCLAFGLLSSIPFIPMLNRKFGVGQSTKYGIFLFALSFNLPLLATSYLMLCAGLFLTGIFSGFTDVSMNALVSTIERKNNAHFMSAAHGFFSLGGFIGAGLGSLLMSMILNPFYHMLSVSIFIIITNLYLSKYYNTIEETPTTKVKSKSNLKTIRPLLGLSIVAFIIMFNEGAVEHWSNLFLFDKVQVSEYQAGLGFIAFSLCMTIGRFLGDGISKRIGPTNIILGACAIAFTGYLGILTTSLYLSVAGFGILGLGLSVIIPELFRLAGNTNGVDSSTGISIVSGIGFAGFLFGPVCLGLIADWADLTWSFGALAISLMLVLGMTFFGLKRVYKKE
jgi:fucose permease